MFHRAISHPASILRTIVTLTLSLLLVSCELAPGLSPTTTSTAGPTDLTPSAILQPGVSAMPPATTSEPATPTQPFKPPYGIEISHFDDIEPVRQAGAEWVRRNALLWQRVEPEKGVRNWEAVRELEHELQAVAALGLQPILIVRGTPSWAQKVPGSTCGPIKNDQLVAFADFLAEAVARYSAPPYNLRYWEIANEPDIDPSLVGPDSVFGCWGDANDPYYGGAYYARLLQAVYPRVKSVDPAAQILVGGLLLNCDPVDPPETSPGSGQLRDCSPSRFLEGILKNNGGEYFDGVSFHAYDYFENPVGYSNANWHSSWRTTGPSLASKARYIRELLAQYGHPEKYLLNTEVALLCGRDGREDFCQTENFQRQKASYVAQAYTAALAQGLRVNVWYSLAGWRGSGLVNTSEEPFLAYQAYQFNAQMLREAIFQGELGLQTRLLGYQFRRNDTIVWILWATNEADQVVALPGAPTAAYDVLGNPLPVAPELTITASPIYLEWTP